MGVHPGRDRPVGLAVSSSMEANASHPVLESSQGWVTSRASRGLQYRHGGKVPGMLNLPQLPGHGSPHHPVHYDELDMETYNRMNRPRPNTPCRPCPKGMYLCQWECVCIPEKLR